MKWMGRVQQVFGFTKSESRIVLFLVLMLFAGGIIRYFDSIVYREQEFDYSVSDSVFRARSTLAGLYDSAISVVNPETTTNKPASEAGTKVSPGYLIDLNRATKEQLMKLPGVGEHTASRIIQYREERGGFRSVQDLHHVKGIGAKKFERIAPHVKVQ